jgi:hypothetical protein
MGQVVDLGGSGVDHLVYGVLLAQGVARNQSTSKIIL